MSYIALHICKCGCRTYTTIGKGRKRLKENPERVFDRGLVTAKMKVKTRSRFSHFIAYLNKVFAFRELKNIRVFRINSVFCIRIAS